MTNEFLSDIINRKVSSFSKHNYNTYKITFSSKMNDNSNGTPVELFLPTEDIVKQSKEWFIKKCGIGGISTLLNSKLKWQLYLYNNDGEQTFWCIDADELKTIVNAYNHIMDLK